MPVKTKKTKARSKKAGAFRAIVDPTVGNYEKHPFFVKKANEMKALIERVGLPEELTKKK